MINHLYFSKVSFIILSVLFLGCGGNPDTSAINKADPSILSTNTTSNWTDGNTQYISTRTIENVQESQIEKVYFRSSHIEFWSIDDIADVDDLISAAYLDYFGDNDIPSHLIQPASIELKNIPETVIFRPGKETRFDVQNVPRFEQKIYNLVRLDLGGGEITFIINGQEQEVLFSDSDDKPLDCNSIFFVDSAYLNQAVYINRGLEDKIINGETTSGIAIVDALINNGYGSDISQGIIDLDGALFMPFSPADLNAADDITKISVNLTWDMNNCVTYNDNDTPQDYSDDFDFRMVNHIAGTCFNFSLIVNPTIVDSNVLALKSNVVQYLSSAQADAESTLVQDSLEQLYNRAHDYYLQMNSNGSWSDLDYSAEPQSSWDSGAHFQRLAVLARAYVTPHQSFNNDITLLHRIELGLTHIHQYIFKGCDTRGNYWWWKVSIPQELGTVLLLLEGELDSEIYIESLETMIYMMNLKEYIFEYWDHKIGATKLQICLNVLNYALIAGNTSLIQEIQAIMSENCQTTGPEQIGIKDDYSYHYHLNQLYFGDYGACHGEAIIRYMFYTQGTAMQLFGQDKAVIVNYLAEGLSWPIVDYYYDPSVLGRGYPRSPFSNIQLAINALTLMTQIDNDRQDYFIAVVKKIISNGTNLPDHPQIASYMAGIQNNPIVAAYPSGHKYYNRSDFTIHRTQDCYMSVKMLSERMIAYEYMNGDGKQSWHLSDGVTFVYFNGDGYYKNNMQPTLDWTRLPGTTVEQKEYDIEYVDWNVNYGTAEFVGGCHYGPCGVSAMAHEALQSDLVAKKSWFFFDREMVCLGSGITCETENNTETIINQWPLSAEDAALYVDGQLKPATLNYSETLNNIMWAHCDDIGYYFPKPQPVNLKREMQTGKWSDITDAVTWDDWVYSNPFLTLWFDHGTAVRNGSYSYAVIPNITHTDMAAYADSRPFTILAHNNSIHAVKDRSTNSTGIVFWRAGSLDIVEVNQPCIVYYQVSKAGSLERLNIAVSDPTQELSKLYVYLPFDTETINVPTGVIVRKINIGILKREIITRLEINTEGGKSYKCSFKILDE